ncbi:myb-like protein AA [Drosophila sechellia]|nr:myb-like protein AA [Drosophila sechellia]
MRNGCCVWALLALGMCLVATRVAGETMIEVDENGDEYELKRFYIQGRQLKGDGSQSQCVVTRRKRSGRAAGSGSGSAATLSVSSQPLKVESLPAKEHREGGAVLQEVESNSNRRYVALTGVHLESPLPQADVQNDDNDDDDEEDDDGDDQSSRNQSNFVPAALALPLQSQSTAAHLNQAVSVVANAASHAHVAEDAGIVVVQSHQPPKVNPDTHAVFELKPVQSDVVHQSAGVSFYPFVQPWEVVDQDEDDYDEDDYDEEDYDDFYYGGNGFYRDQPGFNGLGVFEEEIISEDQPVSTIASWSTGDDDSDILPAVNKRPNQKNKNKKNQKQKNKNQQQKNKRQQQKKRKQQAQNDEQPAKQKKKPQQQDKDQKKKQDKDQKKKKPEENPNQQEMEQLTPVEVIKKPVAMEQSAGASSATSSSNVAASSSGVSSSGSNSSDKKKNKKKKKKKPSSSSSLSQRRTKKKKKQSSSSSSSINSSSSISSSSNKRRRPSYSIGSSSSSSSIGGYRRRRPQQQQLQQQRRRKTQQQQKRRRQQQQQKRRRQQQQQQRRRLRNKNRQFYGDEPIINCIYINKDPATTTTTPRPFWNILGRQSDAKPSAESSVVSSEESQTDPVAQQAVLQAVRRNFGEFGGRKRTNLRFVS